jgi:hypothetical protein
LHAIPVILYSDNRQQTQGGDVMARSKNIGPSGLWATTAQEIALKPGLFLPSNRAARRAFVQRIAAQLEQLNFPFQDTEIHQNRVAAGMKALAQKRGYNPTHAEEIAELSLFHDIGKIGIPLEILDKPGFLSLEERQIINHHTLFGDYIFRGERAFREYDGKYGGRVTRLPENWVPSPDLTALRQTVVAVIGENETADSFAYFARYHHEQTCGFQPIGGRPSYPDGLTWPELTERIGPEFADLIGMAMIVDPFDAMAASDRPYRPACMSVEKTFDFLEADAAAGRRPPDMLNAWKELIITGYDFTQALEIIPPTTQPLPQPPRQAIHSRPTRLKVSRAPA